MPSPLNVTQIPALRVPIIDQRTGLMSREWYLFFFNLFNLTGSGGNAASVEDLLQAPPDSALSSDQAVVANALEALGVSPQNTDSAQAVVTDAIQALNVAREDADWMAQQLLLFNAIDGLSVAPANTPQLISPRYGSFSDSTTQTAAAINTAYAVAFDTTELSNGVYIGSPTSRVYVDRLGVYNFQFSAQLNQSNASAHDIWIWADINGTSVPRSATQVTLIGNNAAAAAAWNFVLELNAGDYFRLMWAVSNTACQITAAAAVAPVPAIPSVILTVTDNIGAYR